MIKRLNLKKQSKISLIASLFLIISVLFLLYVLWENIALSVETFNFETDKLTLESDFKIAHLSDYHNSQSDKLTNDVIESLKENEPDIIVLTGDLADSRKTDIERAVGFVSKIVKIAPVYYVTGNHECNISIKNQSAFDNMIDGLESLGVIVLQNMSSAITLPNGEKIEIAGINDPYFHCENENEVKSATEKLCSSFDIDEDEFNILLAHHPEQLEIYSNCKFDLVFSGHAHGGQVRFFNKSIIAPDQGLFPEYTDGLYETEETTLVVSRGIGNSIIPLRVFCRPHLIYVNIKK